MDGYQNYFAKPLRDRLESTEHICQPICLIDVLGPVQRNQEIFERLDVEFPHYITALDVIVEGIDDLLDRIAGDKDTVEFDAFANKIFLTAFGVRHQDGA